MSSESEGDGGGGRNTRINVTRIVVSTLIAAYVGKQVYKSLPSWMKAGDDDDDDPLKYANDDIAVPSVILGKLREMIQLLDDMVDEPNEMSWYEMYACLLAYTHYQRELVATYPDYYNGRYETNGRDVYKACKVDQMEELHQYCTYAQWAYITSYLELHSLLKGEGYELIRHDTSTEPGRVGHYVAANHDTKRVIISVKGTSTIADALTDLLGYAVDHQFVDDKGEVTNSKVHEGIYTAAKTLLDDTRHLVEKFFLPQKYHITVTGHSLGAGVSCLLGTMLQCNVSAVTPKNLRVLAYATPACLDYHTSVSASSYTTSVVNNTDCVPRLSVANVVSMNALFNKVRDKLNELGRFPSSDWKSIKAFIKDLSKVDEDLLFSLQEMKAFELKLRVKYNPSRAPPTTPEEAAEQQREKEVAEEVQEGGDEKPLYKDHALFVPGRVVVMWEKTAQQDGENKGEGEQGGQDEEEQGAGAPVVVGARIGDGGMSVLRMIEIDDNMISDHSCVNYLKNLSSVMEQMKKTK